MENISQNIWIDRAGRHDFWSLFFAIHSPFLLPSLLRGKKKGKRMTKVVVKSHAFLLDPGYFLSNMIINQGQGIDIVK
jgi:hypothetical protein